MSNEEPKRVTASSSLTEKNPMSMNQDLMPMYLNLGNLGKEGPGAHALEDDSSTAAFLSDKDQATVYITGIPIKLRSLRDELLSALMSLPGVSEAVSLTWKQTISVKGGVVRGLALSAKFHTRLQAHRIMDCVNENYLAIPSSANGGSYHLVGDQLRPTEGARQAV